jgi:replication factor C subunit 1
VVDAVMESEEEVGIVRRGRRAKVEDEEPVSGKKRTYK